MQTMSLRIPDYLKTAVNDVCQGEKISLNHFIIIALSEKASVFQTVDIIEKKAAKASKNDFLTALSQIPSKEPHENDKL